jgi:hypothetical protein
MYPPRTSFSHRTLVLWTCLVLLFFIQHSHAQPPSCSDTLRTIHYRSPAFSPATGVTDLTAIGTSDGGELYFFNRVVPGGDSLVLLRADASGNVLWSREINEAEPTYGWFFSHAIELGPGGFVLSAGPVCDPYAGCQRKCVMAASV